MSYSAEWFWSNYCGKPIDTCMVSLCSFPEPTTPPDKFYVMAGDHEVGCHCDDDITYKAFERYLADYSTVLFCGEC